MAPAPRVYMADNPDVQARRSLHRVRNPLEGLHGTFIERNFVLRVRNARGNHAPSGCGGRPLAQVE